jgi:hypothetical protein
MHMHNVVHWWAFRFFQSVPSHLIHTSRSNIVMDTERMVPGGFHRINAHTSDGVNTLYTGDDYHKVNRPRRPRFGTILLTLACRSPIPASRRADSPLGLVGISASILPKFQQRCPTIHPRSTYGSWVRCWLTSSSWSVVGRPIAYPPICLPSSSGVFGTGRSHPTGEVTPPG